MNMKLNKRGESAHAFEMTMIIVYWSGNGTSATWI